MCKNNSFDQEIVNPINFPGLFVIMYNLDSRFILYLANTIENTKRFY